jgi:transglutaminase-like putative cysteine protease
MRIRVDHATTYDYEAPADGVVQALRLTPSNHESQRVLTWRIDVDADGLLRARRDAFGNILHLFYAEAPVTRLTIRVAGEAEVEDASGVVRGVVEPFPVGVFLRQTPATAPDEALVRWARATAHDEPLETLHALMSGLNARMTFENGATEVTTGAAEAFKRKRGVCQDYAQIFAGAARALGIPARYVSGHLAHADGSERDASHAWVEAFVPDLGWTAFDPANGVCPNETYLRVAAGLDYLDCAPIRGARRGGGAERLSVAVTAARAPRQRQQ